MKQYTVRITYKFTIQAEDEFNAEEKAIQHVLDVNDCPDDIRAIEQEDES
jgi:hypothetical protein